MDSSSRRQKDPDGSAGKAIVRRRPPTIAEFLTSTSSTLATIMFAWTIIRQYCPQELRRFLQKYTARFMGHFYPYIRISIYEFVGERLNRSKAFSAVEAYLSNKVSDDAKRLTAEIGASKNSFVLSMDEFEKVKDKYERAEVWWILSKTGSSRKPTSMHPDPDRRFYQLTFHKKHRKLIIDSYLKHVWTEGREIRVSRRQRKLYTNGTGNRWPSYRQTTVWSEVDFRHPATFDTIAMDPEKKGEIVEDLLTFSQSKDYYARIGKAWKRGYLLYGPPGTGKSTMIAAMANLLKYDVYDLELTAVKDNTELRKLLIETTSKSIIVIEDIDCSLDLTGQRKRKKSSSSKSEEKEKPVKASPKEEDEEAVSRVTLSGLLNFIDGIWSACGGERLIVFTTNHVEKLDPALIRPGRMDKHIELSYCSYEAFKVLAKNYLNMETHPVFGEIEELIKDARMTPADVAENLMPKSRQDGPENSLGRLIRSLQELKIKAAAAAAAEMEETEKAKTEISPNDSSSERVNGEFSK